MNSMAHTFPVIPQEQRGRPQDNDPPPPPDQVRQNIPIWVPLTASFAILVGISLCAYLVFNGDTIKPTTFFLALLMLLFSLGTLTAMLFTSSASFKATTGQFSMMIAGPAAIWFGGTFAIMLSPMGTQMFRAYEWPETIAKLENTIMDAEQAAGWIPYSDWKKENNKAFYEQVTNEERTLLSELLENAFAFPRIPGEADRQRNLLKAPEITTAFLYFPKLIVKFQMVSGKRQDDAYNGKTDLFFGNRATDDRSPKTSLLCADADPAGNLTIRSDIVEFDRTPNSHGWQKVAGEPVNCLLAARYEDVDRTQKQDRILIDMKKFTNEARYGGTINLAIWNYKYPIARESVMWQMKASVGTRSSKVPLVFRSYDTGNLPSLFVHAAMAGTEAPARDDPRYAVNVQKKLAMWLKLVDDYLRQDPDEWSKFFYSPLQADIAAQLKEMNYPVGDSPSLTDLLSATPKGVSAFHVKNATDVSIVFVKPQR
jgi:hypothetical protein